MKTIGILGAGNVGGTLGRRLRDLGHTVRWGVRDPSSAKYQGMDVASVAETARDAEIVILAVPWPAAEETIRSAGDLSGKVLVDATNRIAADFSDLVPLDGSSAAEHVARWAPGARVVKAFNTIGSNVMENPNFGGQRATLLLAGDDAEAKKQVTGLAEELGFGAVDAGPLRMARHLESLAWIWITQAIKQDQGREIVFQLLHR